MSIDLPDIQLIPADEDPPIAEEFADLNVADVNDDTVVADSTQPFGSTWLFDLDMGQFVMYGTTAVEVSGTDAVRMWCLVALCTKRFAHPIFSEDFGMNEPDRLLGRQFAAERNAEYIRDIQETLLVHDRITEVSGFAFQYDPDTTYLEMSCTIVLDNDEEVQLDQIPLVTDDG